MDKLRKPFDSMRGRNAASLRSVSVRLAAFAITLFSATLFFNERHLLELHNLALQDRVTAAEMRLAEAETLSREAEDRVLSLEASLAEAEGRFGGAEVRVGMPLGYSHSKGYSGPPLSLYSCGWIVIEGSESAEPYDHGLGLLRYRVWNRRDIRKFLEDGEYQLVGDTDWTTDWDGEGQVEYFIRDDLQERDPFEWNRDQSWNDAYWGWFDHMSLDCRLSNR